MTECQGCGAWNDRTRTVCVLCGTPLAATDEWDAAAELPPLPPLPDGGLAASMPAWLREPPAAYRRDAAAGQLTAAPALSAELAPLGPTADPRTFLSDDDFPRWLRELAARTAPPAAVAVGELASASMPAALAAEPIDGMDYPEMDVTGGDELEIAPSLPAREPQAPTPGPVEEERPTLAAVAAHPIEERHERSVWETVLLVLLFIGVVAAALWALISNGVLGLG
jgi:hypothetical protein